MEGSKRLAPVKIGVLVPLTKPGWIDAGTHLLAGLQCAAEMANAAGGINGRPLKLLLRDTAADPQRAITAVDELAREGIAVLAGEYHSVVARAAATRACALQLPYLCSSAVLDSLVEYPTHLVARIAPAQSHSWHVYADYLRNQGHANIAVAIDSSSLYWRSGAQILRKCLTAYGGTVREIAVQSTPPEAICDELARESENENDNGSVQAILLLTGFPEPAVSIVKAIKADARLSNIEIGAPAGQPEFAEWLRHAENYGQSSIPFLRYLPPRLSSYGLDIARQLHERLSEPPSFVAFEGYDTILVLTWMLRLEAPEEGSRMSMPWSSVDLEGTRGRIRFSQDSSTGVWQWTLPPVQVVDRDPDDSSLFRVLLQSSAQAGSLG